MLRNSSGPTSTQPYRACSSDSLGPRARVRPGPRPARRSSASTECHPRGNRQDARPGDRRWDVATARTPLRRCSSSSADPFPAIRRGRQLFQRKFTQLEGQGPRVGDGIGDVGANLALGAGLADTAAGCMAGHAARPAAGRRRRDAARQPRRAPSVRARAEGDAGGRITATCVRSAAKRSRRRRRTTWGERELTSKGIPYGIITARGRRLGRHVRVDGVDQDLRLAGSSRTAGRSPSASSSSARCRRDGLAGRSIRSRRGGCGGHVVTPFRHVLDARSMASEAPPTTTPRRSRTATA